MKVGIEVNGKRVEGEVSPWTTLLEFLRDHRYWGVKHGCESGECGACTVMLDGELRVSCLTLAAAADGSRVTTVEALGTAERLHPIQAAFVAEGAIQCGYCTPGMILAAKDLLDRNPDPTEAQIRDHLAGVLCRCTGYVKPVRAVQVAARRMKEGSHAST